MKRVYWEDLEPGMVIARTVVGLDGRALLNENTRLTPSYIERLDKLGIRSVYIKDGLSDIDIPEIVSVQALAAVSQTLEESIKDINRRNLLDMASLKRSVSLLVEDILNNQHLLIQLEDIRSYDDYLYFHSINVAIFSIMTGLTMGYPESKLMDLGLGALLHDIGMIMLDPRIGKKKSPLSQAEIGVIRTHCEIGFNILKTYQEVSATTAHVAYQHHERVDGSGYPRQLDGRQILEYARIVAVADTFAALISDRPYRNGYTSTEAVSIMGKLSNSYFDPIILEAFTSNVAIYPVGSILLLNSGNLALVTSVTKTNSTRPIVHVISDSKGNLLSQALELDLNKNHNLNIVRRLNNQELDLLRSRINALVSQDKPSQAPVEAARA